MRTRLPPENELATLMKRVFTITTNAPGTEDTERRVRITHPFHPQRGQVFVLVDVRRNRHGDRVWYQLDEKSVSSIPVTWTSLSPCDAFEFIAAGRAPFRPADLLALTAFLDTLGQSDGADGPVGWITRLRSKKRRLSYLTCARQSSGSWERNQHDESSKLSIRVQRV